MSSYTHQGRVYFVVRGQYVKIGYTATTIEKRMAALGWPSTACPPDMDFAEPLWLLHTIPGCVMRDERRIQGLFGRHRVEGEWFQYTPEFRHQFDRLQYVTYSDSLKRFRAVRADIKRRPSFYLSPTSVDLEDVAA